MVEWLRLHASTAKSMSLIPGWGTKILHATQHDQEKQTNKQDLCSNRKSDTCVLQTNSPESYFLLFVPLGQITLDFALEPDK